MNRYRIFLFAPCLLFASTLVSARDLRSIDHKLTMAIQGDNSHAVLDYTLETVALASPFIEFASVYHLCRPTSVFPHDDHLRTAAVALFTSYASTVALKYIIRRERPARNYRPRLWNTRITPSFPSGHVASSALFATWVWTYHPSLAIPASLYLLASAYSQVHIGNHYFGDALGGAVLGIVIGKMIFHRNKKGGEKYTETPKRKTAVGLTLRFPLTSKGKR